jgi:hypothetical protein
VLSSEEMSESLRAFMRHVFPDCTAKRVSRLFNVPVRTATHWIYVRVSKARANEIANKLIEESYRVDRENEEWRRQIRQIMGDR